MRSPAEIASENGFWAFVRTFALVVAFALMLGIPIGLAFRLIF